MTYAGDRLYNEVIRKMMGRLASNVRVREIIAFLPCLTLSDREEIEAKREIAGNYNAMMVLLDNLRRRENWPDEFISALWACEQRALADEISEAYNKISGIRSQRTATAAAVTPAAPPAPVPALAAAAPAPAPTPAAASATVTAATIHSVPHSTPPLLTPPSMEAPAQSAVPALINSPPEPLPNIAAPVRAEAPDLVSAPEAPVYLSPEPDHSAEPPLSVLAPHARLPSLVSAPKVTPSVGPSEVPVSSRATSTLDISKGLTPNALSGPSPVVASSLPTNTTTSSISNKSATPSQIPISPEKSKVPVAVTESSSSVKHPIQETNPPEEGTVLAQDSQNNSTTNQLLERVNTAVLPNCQAQATPQGTAQISPSPIEAVAGSFPHVATENEECFCKPGILRGEEPLSDSSDDLEISHATMEAKGSPIQPARPQAVANPHRAEEPVAECVSVNTDDLMISSSTTAVPSQRISDPIAPVQNSTPEAPPCLENGFPEANQPVEDHFESSCQSLQAEHIVMVSEEPSIQNLNDHPPSMFGPSTISLNHNESESLVQPVSEDQTTQHHQGITRCMQGHKVHASEQVSPGAGLFAEPAPATFQESGLNASSQINSPTSEQREEFQGVLGRFTSDPRLIAAAAIGMTAVFVAWRLKY